MKKIILASNSPRRKDILSQLGLEFQVEKSNFKEVKDEIFKIENIKKNSLGKALEIANRFEFEAIVIGADTMVILDSVCLNKPRNQNEAFLMLKNLSGKTHKVITSISIVETKTLKNFSDYTTTKVTFKKLSDDEILTYIKEKNPLDKAGSYGIQDFIPYEFANTKTSGGFIEKIEGDYYNVVGMSKNLLEQILKNF